MFFITLVSGSNELQYKNTSSRFTNQLPIPLDLDDDIEFGVCELSYIKCIDNIETIPDAIMIFDHLYELITEGEDDPLFGKTLYIDLPRGYYANEHELSEVLNKMIWKLVPRLKDVSVISYNKNIRRFVMQTEDLYITIGLHKKLIKVMTGKDDKFLCFGMEKARAGYQYRGKLRQYAVELDFIMELENDGPLDGASMLNSCDTMFLYCDLVYQQYSGNSFQIF